MTIETSFQEHLIRLEHPDLNLMLDDMEQRFLLFDLIDLVIREKMKSSSFFTDVKISHDLSGFGYKLNVVFRKHLSIIHVFPLLLNLPSSGLTPWKKVNIDSLKLQLALDEIMEIWVEIVKLKNDGQDMTDVISCFAA